MFVIDCPLCGGENEFAEDEHFEEGENEMACKCFFCEGDFIVSVFVSIKE